MTVVQAMLKSYELMNLQSIVKTNSLSRLRLIFTHEIFTEQVSLQLKRKIYQIYWTCKIRLLLFFCIVSNLSILKILDISSACWDILVFP